MTNTQHRPISQIAQEIINDWQAPYYGVVPYLRAMKSLRSVNDMYYQDSAKSIINYFLANAGGWRGEKAREIKKELKGMVG